MKRIIIAVFLFNIIYPAQAQIIPENMKAPSYEKLSWVTPGLSSKDLQGKKVLIEFWASWCGGCIQSFGRINKFAEKYGKDIFFVSIATEDTRTAIDKALKKHELRTPVAFTEDNELRKHFGGTKIPRTVLIDEKGSVRWIGFPEQLNEGILESFISKNIIPPLPPKVEYVQVSIKDAEEREFVRSSIDDGEPYVISYEGHDLQGIVSNLISNTQKGIEPKFLFTGKTDLNPLLDVRCTVKDGTYERVAKTLLASLSETFHFTWHIEQQQQKRWVLKIVDMKKLSAVQQMNVKDNSKREQKETETEVVLSDTPIYALIWALNGAFDQKVICLNETDGYFNVSFPKEDFSKARKALFMNYGIEIVERDVAVPVCYVHFHGAEQVSLDK